MLKDIINEIDNSITDEELIKICSEEILLERKEFSFKNFILKIKQLKYNALPHFKYAKNHVAKIAKTKFFKKHQHLSKIIKVVAQMELADYLMNQGSTIQEIKDQTGLDNDLLANIIKKYYTQLPKDILRFRLINYRILKLYKMQELFLKKAIIPMLNKQDSVMATYLIKDFEDLIKIETKERAALEKNLYE